MPSNQVQRTLHLLQVYRGLAALFVVLHHATLAINSNFHYRIYGDIFGSGFSGVSVFFVLSGFIIVFIHSNDIDTPNRATPYLYKRATRIYPIYLITLMLFLAFTTSELSSIPAKEIIQNISLIPLTKYDNIVGVSWTLVFELIFYFFFLLLILSKSIGIIAISAWLILITYFATTGEILSPPYSLSTITGLDYAIFTSIIYHISQPVNLLFGLGTLAFITIKTTIWNNNKDKLSTASLIIGSIIFLVFSIAWTLEQRDYMDVAIYRISFGISAFFLILGACSARADDWASRRPFLLLLGEASYSIYLIHPLIQHSILIHTKETDTLNHTVIFILLTVLSIGGGILLSRSVEIPLLRKCRQYYT